MVLKKGQVTIFIIIGIILVISIGVFIYLYQAKVVRPFEEVVVPSVERAPAEIRPVQDYVASCVETVGRDALQRVGDYGGYVGSSQFLYNPFMPTEGDAVQFSPDSGLIVPYWWYLKSPNDCTGECEFSSLRPALRRAGGRISIEAQLDEYVNENLKNCLAGFPSFVEQGFEFAERGPVDTETTVAREQVYFLVDYPLRISRGDQSWNIEEYLAELDVNLGRIYELASRLSDLEAEHSWLEHFTVQMIDSFSAVDSDMLPPMNDFDVKFGQGEIWVKSEVSEGLQEILAGYVPLLQAGNTLFYRPVESPDKRPDGVAVRDKELYEALYNRGLIIPLEEDFTDLGVTFAYLPWWQPYFNANCEGEVCMPQSVSTSLMTVQVGLHKYSFAYDLSYPVLVEIQDPFAFSGEGYSFKFFLESNVRNNFAMPSDFDPLQPVDVSLNTMLCDLNQRSSGNVTVVVRDARNKRGIDGAVVSYACGRESCLVGETSNGTLVTRLPRCIGGLISASAPEYHTRHVPFDVLDERDLDAEVFLQPYRYVDFSVKKFLLGKGAVEWSLNSEEPVTQAMDEDTIIMLQKEASEFEPAFNVVAEVCGMPSAKAPYACGSPPEDNSEGIALVPGAYSVRIYSIKYPKPDITIPRDLRTYGKGLLKQEFYIPDEPIVFDAENPLPVGFAEFVWNLSAKELDSGNAVEFYFINAALDKVPESRRKIEDLGVISKALDYSIRYSYLLEPRVYRKSGAKESSVTVEVE